jgi:hypothetical protein
MAVAALPSALGRGAESSFQSGRRNRMFARRLAAVTSAVVLALGGTAIAAGPAQAWDPGCTNEAGHYEQAGGFITGFRYKVCDHKPPVPLFVTVERYMSPGVYQTVASGMGEATYYCAGFAYGAFRAGSPGDFPILCT